MLHHATPEDIAHVNDMSKVEVAQFARCHDLAVWEGRATVAKYWGDDTSGTPYEVIESEPNLLLTAGITLLWNLLTGAGGTAFNGSNARIAVGDNNAVATAGQTDLQAVTNKIRQVVDSTPIVSTNTATFVATFATGSGNFAGGWQEMGVANTASGATLLNRLVQNFGVKTSAVAWVATMVLTLN